MPEIDPALVARCQEIFAHAWMVRTFVKHSPEVEDFPELMQLARMVFDVSRSLESRIDDPAAYFRQLRKKLGKLKAVAEQFRHDAPLASDHTNFQQAVISMSACVGELERIVATLPAAPAPAATSGFSPGSASAMMAKLGMRPPGAASPSAGGENSLPETPD